MSEEQPLLIGNKTTGSTQGAARPDAHSSFGYQAVNDERGMLADELEVEPLGDYLSYMRQQDERPVHPIDVHLSQVRYAVKQPRTARERLTACFAWCNRNGSYVNEEVVDEVEGPVGEAPAERRSGRNANETEELLRKKVRLQPTTEILHDIDLQVKSGTLLAVCGASGAGVGEYECSLSLAFLFLCVCVSLSLVFASTCMPLFFSQSVTLLATWFAVSMIIELFSPPRTLCCARAHVCVCVCVPICTCLSAHVCVCVCVRMTEIHTDERD
jgi:hypothetical protein